MRGPWQAPQPCYATACAASDLWQRKPKVHKICTVVRCTTSAARRSANNRLRHYRWAQRGRWRKNRGRGIRQCVRRRAVQPLRSPRTHRYSRLDRLTQHPLRQSQSHGTSCRWRCARPRQRALVRERATCRYRYPQQRTVELLRIHDQHRLEVSPLHRDGAAYLQRPHRRRRQEHGRNYAARWASLVKGVINNCAKPLRNAPLVAKQPRYAARGLEHSTEP